MPLVAENCLCENEAVTKILTCCTTERVLGLMTSNPSVPISTVIDTFMILRDEQWSRCIDAFH